MISFIGKILFPPKCACCGTVTGKSEICRSCLESIRWVQPPVCFICGKESRVCSCGKPDRFYRCVVASMYYRGMVRKGMWRFKFQNKVRAGAFFSEEMGKMIRREYQGVKFDLLCAVPLSKKGLKERGYNQCAILCKYLSRNLGIPFYNRALIKCRENQMQHTLPRDQRFINIRDVFAAGQNLVKDKTVLLVDDIMTTGATLNECAKVLVEAGARVVYCAVAAVVG